MRDMALHIEGMHCASCVGRVERALLAVPGVARASVNLATERADIVLTEGVHSEDLAEAVAGAGYQIAEETVDLGVEGMTCASCVARLESSLRAVPGVSAASVNLVTGRAVVRGHADTADLVRAVARAGFTAQVMEHGRADDQQSRQTEAAAILRRDVAIAVVLTLPILIVEMGGHLVPALHDLIHASIGMQGSRVLQFVLTALVLAMPGRRFLVIGLPALVRGRPDMNSLVSLGTLSAFAVSVVATFAPGLLPAGMTDVYYEPAAVIVTLVLVGRYLELRAKGQAAGAIRALIGLQPKMARVRRGGGVVEIDIAELSPGDLVDLRPGERIPADGVVSDGHSWIDAAMVTGESAPVEVHAGSTLIGGTVNQTGTLTMQVTTVGARSVLSQIIKMVEDAQGSKLPVQAMVDRVTMWFVPAVMLAALVTALVWLIWGPEPALSFALVNGVAVLIIACPCAMGLATPTSILAGTGRGAELGVLFRRGDALQQLAGVKVVAFDKTGTLTLGHPQLTDLHVAAGFDRVAVLAAVAAIEARSEHPVARALVAAALGEGLGSSFATGVTAHPGLGVSGVVDDQTVEIGSAAFLQSRGVDLAAILPIADTLAKAGKTPVFVARDGVAAGVLAVQDAPRPEAAAAIRALQDRGLRVVMVSGDNRQTAEAVARTLGITEVQAEVLPGAKRDTVRALRSLHGPVAFVGDGINDAPALAEADVGIAIGTGTDIAVEAADVVLMSGNPRLVLSAIGLSTSTMANIRQNLFWAFAYNAALIPVAAGILYPGWGILLSPALAAGAMALSSLFVIGNALRLAHFKGDVG